MEKPAKWCPLLLHTKQLCWVNWKLVFLLAYSEAGENLQKCFLHRNNYFIVSILFFQKTNMLFVAPSSRAPFMASCLLLLWLLFSAILMLTQAVFVAFC